MTRISALMFLALLAPMSAAEAQTDPFVGQLMVTGDLYCPKGWIEPSGQFLSVAQNLDLFAVLGATYGGNGSTTFALPNLNARVMMGEGQGLGLPLATQGQALGTTSVTLTAAQLPPHSHPMLASKDPGTQGDPTGAAIATFMAPNALYAMPPPATTMSASAVGMTGGNQPFSQYQPSLALRYCIALTGTVPKKEGAPK